MKHKESFTGSRSDFSAFVKNIIPDAFANKLVVEGRKVAIPSDLDLDYDVKYDENEDGGSFTIKVAWDTTQDIEEEEEAEEL